MNDMKNGEVISFEGNWKKRDESYYVHWTRSEPANQIQLAFRNHWNLLCELMEDASFN